MISWYMSQSHRSYAYARAELAQARVSFSRGSFHTALDHLKLASVWRTSARRWRVKAIAMGSPSMRKSVLDTIGGW